MKTRKITITVPAIEWPKITGWWVGCVFIFFSLFMAARWLMAEVESWRFLTAYVLLAIALAVFSHRNDASKPWERIREAK